MKIVCLALSLGLVAGCGSKEGSGAPGSAGTAQGTAQGAASGQATSGPVIESFFAGEVPPGVKMRDTKTFAMDPGILLIQGVEGWSGGKLPGYEYMAMSKDSRGMARVAASNGVTNEMNCKDLATAAAMAPLRAKNIKESVPAVMRKVGKNGFAAREGICSADGATGPVTIHYLNIHRKDKGASWHYAVLVSYPVDAPPELKNEAKAWARSLEYNGQNGFTMP